MDLLEDLKMSFLKFNFAIIYIIHKMLVLLENYLNYRKDDIFKGFFYGVLTDRILRDIKNLFEHEEEKIYHKQARVSNFWSGNGTEYEINETLSVKEYLNKIRPCLKDIINNLEMSDTCKIQLIIVNNFTSSIDNNVKHVMHSKSDNVEIMINDEADKVIK